MTTLVLCTLYCVLWTSPRTLAASLPILDRHPSLPYRLGRLSSQDRGSPSLPSNRTRDTNDESLVWPPA